MTEGTKWANGTAYGPVLSQTDLYLLNPTLEIHPILTHTFAGFHLVFHLLTGRATGYNKDARDHDLPFEAKDEVATLPRVSELVIVTKHSPWCTVVRNPGGVTLADICGTIWHDYSDNPVTEEEFVALPPSAQDRVRRTGSSREAARTGYAAAAWHYQDFPVNRCKRIDWLRDKVFFDGLDYDHGFTESRLGFSAPNMLVMSLVS